jgi:Tfp pilus assembly pilus retraction ATPase PilT
MPLQSRDQLGPYECIAHIGKGGMGEVWKARDTTLKRDVALKVLPAALLRDSDRMARFQREAEVLLPDRPNLALSTRCRSRKGEDRQRYASVSTGRNEGMLTLGQSLAELVRSARTTRETAFAHGFRPEDLSRYLQA